MIIDFEDFLKLLKTRNFQNLVDNFFILKHDKVDSDNFEILQKICSIIITNIKKIENKEIEPKRFKAEIDGAILSEIKHKAENQYRGQRGTISNNELEELVNERLEVLKNKLENISYKLYLSYNNYHFSRLLNINEILNEKKLRRKIIEIKESIEHFKISINEKEYLTFLNDYLCAIKYDSTPESARTYVLSKMFNYYTKKGIDKDYLLKMIKLFKDIMIEIEDFLKNKEII